MAAPRKCPDELRERAVRLAVDGRKDPATRPAALARIGGQLGITGSEKRPHRAVEQLPRWNTRDPEGVAGA